MGDHPSGTHVAARLMRPKPGSLGRATLKRSPIWSCTGRGLPSRPVTRTAGELLPHRFTLTRTPRKGPLAVCSLLRFPSGFPGWPLTSALLCGVRTFLDGRLAGSEELRDADHRGHLACLLSVPPGAPSQTFPARDADEWRPVAARSECRPAMAPSTLAATWAMIRRLQCGSRSRGRLDRGLQRLVRRDRAATSASAEVLAAPFFEVSRRPPRDGVAQTALPRLADPFPAAGRAVPVRGLHGPIGLDGERFAAGGADVVE